MSGRATTTRGHESAAGRWEMVSAAPARALAGAVRGYVGYRERLLAPVARREVATPSPVLILGFGDPIRVGGPGASRPELQREGAFAAGLSERHALTEHDGRQEGVQVDLSPLALRALLGVPPGELTNRVVALDDLLGRAGDELLERLAEATSWEARFGLLDGAFARRLTDTSPPPRDVVHAYRRLVETRGRVRIAALAGELGRSRTQLSGRFREHVGLPPKTLARVVRFGHARERLSAPRAAGLAEVAFECGYSDQAHLSREFVELAGVPPGAYLARRLPDGAGIAA